MKSVLKKGLIAGGALAALVVASGGGLRLWLEGRLGKEAIVAQMESSWNCRAQIDSVSWQLLANPARLEIVGCRIVPRDGEVAKPLAQRTPLATGKADVSISRAVLEVKLQDLVSRRLNIQRLLLSGIDVREDVTKQGESSLGALFSKPAESEDRVAAAAAVQRAAPNPPPPSTPAPPKVKSPEPAPAPPIVGPEVQPEARKVKREAKGFDARELGFSIQVSQASLEGVSLYRSDHRSASQTTITDLRFSITDIDVNPDDLAAHNRFKLTLNGRLKQQGRIGPKDARRSATLADVSLDGDGTVQPFNVESGKWQPVSALRLTLTKGSVIGGYMKLGETGSKDLKKLDDYGIDLRDVSLGGPLLEDAVIRVTFQQDRITLQEDARFAMPDFELLLQKESWLNGAEDQHEMQVRITCGPKLQQQVIAGAIKFGLSEGQALALVKALSDEKGRLYFDLLSTKRLSKPDVKPDVRRLINRVLEGLGGGGLIEGLLKK